MKFVNDPQAADLAPVGAGVPVLVAFRTQCGEAFRWEPGGDAAAMADFLGPNVVAVEGTVYQRGSQGTLTPIRELLQVCVAVRPPAGDVIFLSPAQFETQWAKVDAGSGEGERAGGSTVAAAAPDAAPRKKPGPKPKGATDG